MVHIASLIFSLVVAASYATLVLSIPESAVAHLRSPGSEMSADITFTENTDMNSLEVTVQVKKFAPGQQYSYSINQYPVPDNGDCQVTGGVLDPTHIKIAGKPYNCDLNDMDRTCQLGDLSGKYGIIAIGADGSFSAFYADRYLSTGGSDSIIKRSVVIINSVGERTLCGNIVM